MTTDIIKGLIEMGFVISKVKGEPYVIDRLHYGEKIYGPQGSRNDGNVYMKRNEQEKQLDRGKKGMERIATGEKLKSTKGTYMRKLRIKIDNNKPGKGIY